MGETFYKYIGCGDCESHWRTQCPLCKQKGNSWRDENGRHVQSHQLTEESKCILRHTKKDYAVLFDDRIIIPPKLKVKKQKIVLKNSNKIKEVPIQPLPITFENFFLATKGVFEELNNIPEGYRQIFKSKGSEYFIGENNTVLIRKSDHWGYGIKYCNWYLKGYGFGHCAIWKKNQESPLKIGKIEIINLEANFINNTNKTETHQLENYIPPKLDLTNF